MDFWWWPHVIREHDSDRCCWTIRKQEMTEFYPKMPRLGESALILKWTLWIQDSSLFLFFLLPLQPLGLAQAKTLFMAKSSHVSAIRWWSSKQLLVYSKWVINQISVLHRNWLKQEGWLSWVHLVFLTWTSSRWIMVIISSTYLRRGRSYKGNFYPHQ